MERGGEEVNKREKDSGKTMEEEKRKRAATLTFSSYRTKNEKSTLRVN